MPNENQEQTPHIQVDHAQKKVSAGKPMGRREFLKLGILWLASLAGLKNLAEYFGLLGRLEENAFTSGLPDELPPSLQQIEIPQRNEFLRRPQDIVREAFDIYNNWSAQDPSLPQLNWRKPKNYLEYSDIIMAIGQPTSTPGYESLDGLAWKLEDAVYKNDQPYSKFSYFGASDIHDAENLILIDPGCGIVKKTVEKFKKVKNEESYDLYKEIDNKRFSDEDKKGLVFEIKDQVSKAISFIEERSNGKPVSTSLLLAYFLHQNSGSISHSLWDTTAFLKLICRNNLDTLQYEPTRAGADKLAALFLDEFSPQVSLNWLCKNVSPADTELNIGGQLEGREYKNYQPINRAGGLYHAWNIISWATCMSPDLAMNLTKSFYLHGALGGYDIRPSNGSEKVRTDLQVASYTDDVRLELLPYYAP